MGGSFNPVTEGHVQLAQEALANSYLEEVWLVPCYKHLQKDGMTDASHRVEMCELAVKDTPKVKVFDYEIKNELKGSTYDFIMQLFNDDDFQDYEFSCVIGADCALRFNTWKNYEELRELINFVTLPRLGYMDGNENEWFRIEPHIFVEVDIRPIASTYIREWMGYWWSGECRAWADAKLKDELNSDVLSYIKAHKLYKENVLKNK